MMMMTFCVPLDILVSRMAQTGPGKRENR